MDTKIFSWGEGFYLARVFNLTRDFAFFFSCDCIPVEIVRSDFICFSHMFFFIQWNRDK